jgi:hypothetical protein
MSENTARLLSMASRPIATNLAARLQITDLEASNPHQHLRSLGIEPAYQMERLLCI